VFTGRRISKKGMSGFCVRSYVPKTKKVKREEYVKLVGTSKKKNFRGGWETIP